MTERVLGERGSKKRGRFMLLPLLVTAAFALFWIAGAQAVHDTGTFELEGNATNDAVLGDDWDNVCKQVTITDDTSNAITDECASAANTSGATSVAFASEPDRSASIFTGGGSKDPEEIDQWAWKDGAGGLPDKDNLLHAFGARYSVPQVDTTPATSCPTSIAGTTCDILYFGSDRFDNSGDAVQGFWFLQNKVELGSNKVGGGQGFTGLHKPGDLLVLSDFSNGGDVSTIRVFEWVTSGGDTSTHLDLRAESTAAKCDPALGPDPFCGIVSPVGSTDAPWSFLDKSDNTDFANGEFFEAGINLSSPAINLAGVCFASLVSETRSSTSPTATLKDFVLAPFGECAASMVTTPSSSSVSPGAQVTDLAVVTGTSGGTPPNPSSPANVRFFICTPSELTPADTGVCSSGGTELLPSQELVHCTGAGTPSAICLAADAQGVSRARSVAYDTTGKAPGRYCFRATWAGDANYVNGASDATAGECFTVVLIPSTISTSQSWFPNDSATVATTGPAGFNLTGSVAFSLYSNATCTGTALYSQTVNIPANSGLSATVNTTNGNGADGADEAPTDVAISAASGTYSWLVVYTPAASDTAHTGKTSACHDEHSALTITNDDPSIP
jgi:hypothetical protein